MSQQLTPEFLQGLSLTQSASSGKLDESQGQYKYTPMTHYDMVSTKKVLEELQKQKMKKMIIEQMYGEVKESETKAPEIVETLLSANKLDQMMQDAKKASASQQPDDKVVLLVSMQLILDKKILDAYLNVLKSISNSSNYAWGSGMVSQQILDLQNLSDPNDLEPDEKAGILTANKTNKTKE